MVNKGDAPDPVAVMQAILTAVVKEIARNAAKEGLHPDLLRIYAADQGTTQDEVEAKAAARHAKFGSTPAEVKAVLAAMGGPGELARTVELQMEWAQVPDVPVPPILVKARRFQALRAATLDSSAARSREYLLVPMTQAQLAELAQCHENTIHNWAKAALGTDAARRPSQVYTKAEVRRILEHGSRHGTGRLKETCRRILVGPPTK